MGAVAVADPARTSGHRGRGQQAGRDTAAASVTEAAMAKPIVVPVCSPPGMRAMQVLITPTPTTPPSCRAVDTTPDA